MIHFTPVRTYSDRRNLWRKALVQGQCWIVPDLETKRHLERDALAERKGFESDQILRSREFWTLLINRQRPDLTVLRRGAVEALLYDFMIDFMTEPAAEQGERRSLPISRRELLGHLMELAPLWTDPEGSARLSSWVQENAADPTLALEILKRGQEFFDHLAGQGLCAEEWASGWIANLEISPAVWNRTVWLDLGHEWLASEVDAVRRLSQVVDVNVVVPVSSHISSRVEQIYRLLGWTGKRESGPDSFPRTARMKSFLSEAKFAVAKVRAWLDQGVPASDIAVLVPRWGDYDAALAAHFDCEGVPTVGWTVNLSRAAPGLEEWKSNLRVIGGGLSLPDFLACSWSQRHPQNMEQLRSRLAAVSRSSDVARVSGLQDWILRHQPPSRGSLRGYLQWAVQLAPDHVSETDLSNWIQKIRNGLPDHVVLSRAAVIPFLLDGFHRMESSTDADGVLISHVRSLEAGNRPYRVLLGWTQEQMGGAGSPTLFDVAASDLGYWLRKLDPRVVESSALDHARSDRGEVWALAAEENVAGEALTAVVPWLKWRTRQGPDPLRVESPPLTRWDELQATATGSELIAEELGLTAPPSWGSIPPQNVAVSRLSAALQCTFKFVATELWRLGDEPELDMDLSSLSAGTLLHRVLELAGDRLDWSQDQLTQFLDQAFAELKQPLGEIQYWPEFRNQLLEILDRFLAAEARWRELHPTWKIRSREVSFHLGFDASSQSWVLPDPTSATGIWGVRGRIDRMDEGPNKEILIVDYKWSTSGKTFWKSWLEKDDVQLLVYDQAVATGLAGAPGLEVKGLLFYDLRKAQRTRGLMATELKEEFQQDWGRDIWIDAEGRNKLQQDFSQRLATHLSQVEGGQVVAHPRKPEICDLCNVRDLCRAPHLREES